MHYLQFSQAECTFVHGQNSTVLLITLHQEVGLGQGWGVRSKVGGKENQELSLVIANILIVTQTIFYTSCEFSTTFCCLHQTTATVLQQDRLIRLRVIRRKITAGKRKKRRIRGWSCYHM